MRGHTNQVTKGAWTTDHLFINQAKDDVDISSINIFSLARHNRLKELKQVLEMGVDANSKDVNGNTVLIVGAQNGNKAVVKLALRHGGNLNMTNCIGNSALHYAVVYKYTKLADYLRSKGAHHYHQFNVK